MAQPIFNQPSLTGINNSIITGYNRFDVTKFTDLGHLYQLYTKDASTTNLGLLALYNQRRLINTPLINLASASVMYVNGPEGKFKYQIPYDLGCPYVVENLARDIAKPGIDGQKFKIKLSENVFTNTDIITYDMSNGISLYITEDEIYPEGDGFVYTVQIPQTTGNRNSWFPHKYLQPGVEYFKITNVNGEYDTQKSTVSLNGGVLDLELQLGGHRSVYHWITGYADMLKTDAGAGQQVRDWASAYAPNGPKGVTWFMNKDKDGKAIPNSLKWINTIEMLLWQEMRKMEEHDYMWSKGGFVWGSGQRKVRVNTGLYEQMRNGNRIQYTKLTLSLIEEAVSNLYYNSGVPFEERRTVIQVGTGAMIEISKLLADDFNNTNPFLTHQAVGQGIMYGDAMNLGYGFRFTSKRFPVAGTVIFEHNQALDNRYNRAQDGLIGEFPIDSYTLLILDVSDGSSTNAVNKARPNVDYRVANGFNDNSNIVILKPDGYSEVMWGYEFGTHRPGGMGAINGMTSSSQRDGYGIWMKSFGTLWLKDATRTVIIEKTRPI